MAEGITIRITGDDSEFLQTLASLEGEAQATLEALEASAAAAGAAFGAAAMGEGTGATVPALFDDGEGLARQAARVAEAVARAWSGAAVLDAPSVAAPMALLDPEALLEGTLAALQPAFAAAAETLRAAFTEGYLRPRAISESGRAFPPTSPGAFCSGRAGRAGAGSHCAAVERGGTTGHIRRAPSHGRFFRRRRFGPEHGKRLGPPALRAAWGAMRSAARAGRAQRHFRVQQRAGIASPSKVFQRSGRFTGEGFILGYEESIREAQRTVRGLTSGPRQRGGPSGAAHDHRAERAGGRRGRRRPFAAQRRPVYQRPQDRRSHGGRERARFPTPAPDVWRQDGGIHDEKLTSAWLSSRARRNTDRGVRLLSLPVRYHPAERGEFLRVPGRNGSLWAGEDAFDDVTVRVQCQTTDDADMATVLRVVVWRGELRFSDDPERFYRARVTKEFSRSAAMNRFVNQTFTVTFDCQPFLYHREVEDIPLTSSPATVSNPGTHKSAPRLTIEGTGDAVLTIGTQILEVTDLAAASSSMRSCANALTSPKQPCATTA